MLQDIKYRRNNMHSVDRCFALTNNRLFMMWTHANLVEYSIEKLIAMLIIRSGMKRERATLLKLLDRNGNKVSEWWMEYWESSKTLFLFFQNRAKVHIF